MTDPPRPIPTDPAEQERQMPEGVKDYIRRQYPGLLTVSPKASCWPHALDVWRYMPEPVDPVKTEAEKRVMQVWSNGTPDRDTVIAVVASAIRYGQAMDRGEG